MTRKLSRYEKEQLKLLRARDRHKTLETLLSNSDKVIDSATKAGIAYFGYRAFNHWSGALIGLIGLKLSQSQNIAAGLSGVGTLATIGLANVVEMADAQVQTKFVDQWKDLIYKVTGVQTKIPGIGLGFPWEARRELERYREPPR